MPFFWSQHYDTSINYVGHAEKWDRVEIDGTLEDNDAAVAYINNGKKIALATVWRDIDSLKYETESERGGRL